MPTALSLKTNAMRENLVFDGWVFVHAQENVDGKTDVKKTCRPIPPTKILFIVEKGLC